MTRAWCGDCDVSSLRPACCCSFCPLYRPLGLELSLRGVGAARVIRAHDGSFHTGPGDPRRAVLPIFLRDHEAHEQPAPILAVARIAQALARPPVDPCNAVFVRRVFGPILQAAYDDGVIAILVD